jgi:hypothetical protein
MPNEQSLSQRWSDYRPSKALWFWSVVASVIVVLILGFTAGGWTTEGYATTMAKMAARDARAELAAAVCVNKFVSAANAAESLAKLKDASYWQRDDLIEEGGWTKLAGMDSGVPGAADLCVDKLVAMENPPAEKSLVVPSASGG